MTIIHKRMKFNGTHSPLIPGVPDLHVRRSYFWGTKGETEIVGGIGGRNIEATILLHDHTFTSWKKIMDKLKKIDEHVGEHGKLELESDEDENIKQQFDDCTFLGFEWIPLPGQASAGPLQDVVNSLKESPGEPDDRWFIHGRLRWRKLSDAG